MTLRANTLQIGLLSSVRVNKVVVVVGNLVPRVLQRPFPPVFLLPFLVLPSNLKNMWRSLRFQARFKYSGGFSRHIVTAQELETFQKQGVVCLRSVFGEWIEKLAVGIAKNQRSPSKLSERITTARSAQSFYFNDYLSWRQIPEFREFVYKSPAGEIAGKLMEAEVHFYPVLRHFETSETI